MILFIFLSFIFQICSTFSTRLSAKLGSLLVISNVKHCKKRYSHSEHLKKNLYEFIQKETYSYNT